MHRASRVDPGRVQTPSPSSATSSNSKLTTFLDACTTCPDCGTPLKLKARAHRSFRTLFGTFKLFSPRLEHCDCKRRKTSSFRPLSALLTESVAPELLYMDSPRHHFVDTSADASRPCSVIVNPAISACRLLYCGGSLWRLPRMVACCTRIYQTRSASLRIYVNEFMTRAAPRPARLGVQRG